MQYLENGVFFGHTNKTIQLEYLTITETEYAPHNLDWHYHEDAYFTLILSGHSIEGNKKEKIQCPVGSLLFHNWQEPHYNIIPKESTKSLHIELRTNFCDDYLIKSIFQKGNLYVTNPDIKLLFHKMFRESRLFDCESALEIESLFLKAITEMNWEQESSISKTPLWVNKLKDILYNRLSEKNTLEYLSQELKIHPVHLSHHFPRYFHCTLGYYLRKIKVEKALSLLPNRNVSLSNIAFECGFADQSHFIRCFKEFIGINPSAYRKSIWA